MYQSKIQSMVSKMEASRQGFSSKVAEKIKEVDKEIQGLEAEFKKQQDIYVRSDIAGDTDRRNNAGVRIKEIQSKIEDLKGRREAFSRTKSNDQEVLQAANDIWAAAIDEYKEVHTLIEKCDENIENIDNTITELKQKREDEEHTKNLLNHTLDVAIPMSIKPVDMLLHGKREDNVRQDFEMIASSLKTEAFQHILKPSAPDPVFKQYKEPEPPPAWKDGNGVVREVMRRK